MYKDKLPYRALIRITVFIANCAICCYADFQPFPPTVDLDIYPNSSVIYGGGFSDSFGVQSSYKVGDINDDGIDDLAVAVGYGQGPTPDRSDSGKVYITFGRKLWPRTFDIIGTDGNLPDVVIYGANPDDSFAHVGALIFADINGDAVDDLIVGAGRAAGPNNTRPYCGQVCVFLGKPQWPPVIDLRSTLADITIYGPAENSYLSRLRIIEVGDVNGDDLNDLLIGAVNGANGPGGSRPSSGDVFIIYGSSALPSTIDFATHDEDVVIYGASAGLRTANGSYLDGGESLEVGDVNGDGIGDIVLGSQYMTGPSGTRPGAGGAFIVYGSTALPPEIDLSSYTDSVTIHGARPYDRTGADVHLADITGDGISEIIVDAPESPPTNHSGIAYVIQGSPNIPAIIDLADGTGFTEIIGASYNYEMTRDSRVVAGDVNDDGINDLLIGTAFANGPNFERVGSGEAYVIFGSASLPSKIRIADGDEDVLIFGREADFLTWPHAMMISDLNTDGIGDIVLGTSHGNKAYVLYGRQTFSPVYDCDASADVKILGKDAQDSLTECWHTLFSPGDLNGDGANDLVFIAPGGDGPGETRTFAGEVNVLFAPGEPPVVQSTTPGSVTDGNISFVVTFSEVVTGVDLSDFSINLSGTVAAMISSVTGGGSTYTVTIATWYGSGDISLDVIDDDSISDASGNFLGGSGVANGNHVSPGSITVNLPAVSATSPLGLIYVVLLIIVAALSLIHYQNLRARHFENL